METAQPHIPTEESGGVIRQLVQEYLAARIGSPKSIHVRRQALKHLESFLQANGRERLQDICAADLEGWRLNLLERGFAPASLETYARAIRQFFAWLERTQRLFLNPASGFVIPRPPRKSLPVLSPEQVQRLFAQPDPNTATGLRDRALLETVYATGITAREVLSLHCQDVEEVFLHVRGNKARKLKLGFQAGPWLHRYLAQGRPKLLRQTKTSALWLSREGGSLQAEALQQIFRRYGIAAGLGPLSPNTLRRACATHRWRAGTHPLELQMLLGHSSLRTLSQYLRVSVTELFDPPKGSHEAKTIA